MDVLTQPSTLAAFLGVVALAYVVPGPDWFVVLREALGGRRRGLVAVLGVQTGLLVHMTAAAVGVAAVLLASAQAFTVLKLVGAAYLVVLGLRALRDARAGWRAGRGDADPLGVGRPEPALATFRRALLANVLNPKAALFFVAVLPQFVDPGAPVALQVVVLGLLDVLLGLAWWLVFVLAVGAAHGVLRSRRGRAVVDGVAGTALTGLGLALAATGRARA